MDHFYPNGRPPASGYGSSPTSYLDRTAFVAPAAYTFGNLPRTGVYGLNAAFNSSVDISARREFAIHENIKLAIQCDAFNVNNAVRFGQRGSSENNLKRMENPL